MHDLGVEITETMVDVEDLSETLDGKFSDEITYSFLFSDDVDRDALALLRYIRSIHHVMGGIEDDTIR